MKLALTCLLGALSFNLQAAIVCSVEADKSPYDTFTIDFENNQANVSYVRRAFLGSEEVALPQSVPGCDPAQQYDLSSKSLYIECDGDGDAGYIHVNLQTLEGVVGFPEGNIGYVEDTSLKLACSIKND